MKHIDDLIDELAVGDPVRFTYTAVKEGGKWRRSKQRIADEANQEGFYVGWRCNNTMWDENRGYQWYPRPGAQTTFVVTRGPMENTFHVLPEDLERI